MDVSTSDVDGVRCTGNFDDEKLLEAGTARTC